MADFLLKTDEAVRSRRAALAADAQREYSFK